MSKPYRATISKQHTYRKYEWVAVVTDKTGKDEWTNWSDTWDEAIDWVWRMLCEE